MLRFFIDAFIFADSWLLHVGWSLREIFMGFAWSSLVHEEFFLLCLAVFSVVCVDCRVLWLLHFWLDVWMRFEYSILHSMHFILDEIQSFNSTTCFILSMNLSFGHFHLHVQMVWYFLYWFHLRFWPMRMKSHRNNDNKQNKTKQKD